MGYDLNKMSNELKIRRALISDSQDILEWRNDLITRKNSIDTGKISKSEHEEWFKRKLSSKDTDMYIGYTKNKKIGIIRIEKQTDNSAEINININPSERGKGYGTLLLSKGVFEGFSRYDTLAAKVKKGNISSIKIFEKVGFKKDREDGNLFFYKIKNLSR